MQVWASVNEADIGTHPAADMPVRFTVDAFPGEVFRGKVAQIRLNATMTQNVVTYTVVVTFDNSDGKLLPYLTANLQFEVEQRPNVLLVPNAALRWKPRPEQIAPDVRERRPRRRPSARGKGGGKESQPRRPPDEIRPATAKAAKPRQGAAKSAAASGCKDGNFVRPVDVQIGVTDGIDHRGQRRRGEGRDGGGDRRESATTQRQRRHHESRSPPSCSAAAEEAAVACGESSHGTDPTRRHLQDVSPGRSRRPGAQAASRSRSPAARWSR